jgi:valyl-tRNA synthetase
MLVYSMVRDDFCGWYLEAIKPAYQKPIDKFTFDATIEFFDKVVRILHPFMPFISEEIYQLLYKREDGDSIMIAEMPQPQNVDEHDLELFEEAKEVVSFIRNVRKEKNIGYKDSLKLFSKKDKGGDKYDAIIKKLGGLEEFVRNTEDTQNQVSTFVTPTAEYYIPVGGFVDTEKEIETLEKDLKHTNGFIISVQKKLNNERFVNNAPTKVVELEKKKLSDAQAKKLALETQLKIYKV